VNPAAIHSEGLGNPPALNLSGRIPELDGLRGLAILYQDGLN